jgi:transposase InsO family protein
MSLRRAIIEMDTSTVNVTEFCALNGVSTWFFYDLRRRHLVEGDVVLEPKSRAPHRVANKTPDEIEDQVVSVRKELDDAGLDSGPDSVQDWLVARGLVKVPSSTTIWRILVNRGFITPDPSKAPKHTGRRFQAARANELWQLDDTAWELTDGTEVKIFNALDDRSRLLVASEAMLSCTGAAALAVMTAAAAVLGWPLRFLSDNASAFRHVLAEALAALGVDSTHSRPYHPQTNGKVERFHQTLKKWLAAQPRAGTLAELQAQLDAFRDFYNHHRPHRGIGRQRPAHVWANAPKAGPADRPLGAVTTVHQGTVTGGTVSARRRYKISLGAAHNGHQALTVITGTACHVFINGRLIRQLTLDTTRRNQPLHPRPGRPSLP